LIKDSILGELPILRKLNCLRSEIEIVIDRSVDKGADLLVAGWMLADSRRRAPMLLVMKASCENLSLRLKKSAKEGNTHFTP